MTHEAHIAKLNKNRRETTRELSSKSTGILSNLETQLRAIEWEHKHGLLPNTAYNRDVISALKKTIRLANKWVEAVSELDRFTNTD